MPFYEYRCEQCGLKNSLFKPGIAAAEAAAAQLACSRCGSRRLRRIFSRFALGREALDQGQQLYEFDRMTAGLDENEPAQLDRWASSLGAEPDKPVAPVAETAIPGEEHQ